MEIARCPLVELNVAAERLTHPCREVVLHQWPDASAGEQQGDWKRKDAQDLPVEARGERWGREHHVPEPWLGHIEQAPLLFLSSNPSLASYRTSEPPIKFAEPLQQLGDHTVIEHTALRHGLAAPKPQWTDAEIIDRYESGFDVWITDGVRATTEDGSRGPGSPYWGFGAGAGRVIPRQTRGATGSRLRTYGGGALQVP